jgi:flagellar FliL protein
MEEEKKVEEKQEEGQEEPQEESPKKKLPLNIIIICILVLCVLGGGFFVWKSGLLSGLSKKDDIEFSESDISDIRKEIGPIYSMDTFIVNLIGGQGKNYLKTKIDLEMDNLRLQDEINRRLPQFRDAILTMLSSKTHEDIKTLEGKFQLRAEIISILNQYLNTGKIRNVYFTDFIIQ